MKKITFFILCIFMLGSSNYSSSQTPLTDANIHAAVDLWVSDQPTAEATYGHISDWDTSNVTNMSSLFSGKTLFNENIVNWDVSSVTNMWGIFKDALNFNQSIGSWNVSSVTNMSNMFSTSDNVSTSFNQPIGNWNVSSVTVMNRMFQGATAFNQAIGDWDVSSVTNMSRMFQGVWDAADQDFQSNQFNQPIGNWNVSNVTNMTGMFRNSQFNLDIGNWDVSSVATMEEMFQGATLSIVNYDSLLNGWASLGTLQPNVNFNGGLSNYCNGESRRNILINTYGWTITDGGLDCSSISLTPLTDANIHAAVDLWVSDQISAEATYGHISNWDTSNVTNMSNLFAGLDFNLPIGNWDVSNVTNMGWMFESSNFNQPIADWDVSSATNMYSMFGSSDFNQPIGNWDVSNVTDMSSMFYQALEFNQPIGDWDVSNVTNMSRMFQGEDINYHFQYETFGHSEFSQDIGSWDVSSVTNMSSMFSESLFSRSIANWNVSNVTDMSSMFHEALWFNSNIGGWDVSSVSTMQEMFHEAITFNQPIGDWDVSGVTNMSGMFRGVWYLFDADFEDYETQFNQDLGSWDVSNVTNMGSMFRNSLFNQDIDSWNVSNVTNMGWMFGEGGQFNQYIGSWDVGSVTNMYSMFSGSFDDRGGVDSYNPFNKNINSWDVSNVISMSKMFYLADSFNQPIGNWNVSNVAHMSDMFHYQFKPYIIASSFSTENYDNLLIGWATQVLQSNVHFGAGSASSCNGETARDYIINTYGWTITDGGVDCSSISLTPLTDANIHAAVDLWVSDQPTAEATYGHISDWVTSNITNMSSLFLNKNIFNDDISNWDVTYVTDMSYMFASPDNPSGFNQPIGNWDVSSVTNMSGMFYEAVSFNQDISNWDVSSVTNMSEMFLGGDFGIQHAFNQPIGNWDVSSVTNMSGMFSGNEATATDFNQPIENWDVSSVTNMRGMFRISSFNQPIGNWDVSNVTDMNEMFSENFYFNQPIGNWVVSSVTDMIGMFYLATLSNENYDSLLNGWASLDSLQPNVNFSGGGSKYCSGETARTSIINTYGWTITDGGLDCNLAVNCLTVEDANGFLGDTTDINLVMENSEVIKGFQFDITFPDGFVFNPSDITNTGLSQNFQVSCANVGGNSYRVIAFSLSNETIDSGTSSILTFPTFINVGTLEGDYPIPVTNVTLSDINNVDIASLCSTDGIITVYSHPMGDANGDDTVNILDILGCIDYIFGNPPSTFYFDLADVNFDTTINVLDVLGIQDIILSPAGRTFSNDTNTSTADDLVGDNYLIVANDVFTPNTSETIEINLVNEDIDKGFQFDFVLPEGFTLNPADIIGTSRLDGFTISAQEVSTNTYRVIVFSLTSATVASGTGAVLNVPVFIKPDVSSGVYPIAYTDVLISDTNNTDVSTTPPTFGEITIGTLGIGNLENYEDSVKLYPNPVQNILSIDSEFEGAYLMYDLNGRYVGKGTILLGKNEVDASLLQSGLYFIKINNARGTVIKKFIKK